MQKVIDLEQRMCDSKAGRAPIQSEADELVAGPSPLYCSECVFERC